MFQPRPPPLPPANVAVTPPSRLAVPTPEGVSVSLSNVHRVNVGVRIVPVSPVGCVKS